MTGKTICVLSDSCAAPVVSGIQKFRGEFEAYIAGRASRDGGGVSGRVALPPTEDQWPTNWST